MENIKVGEQLSLPVSINNRGAIVQSEGSPINDLKLDLMVTCIAINNHDRLVEENAELREFAKYCQGFLGCEETRGSMALHGITIKAKELLNK